MAEYDATQTDSVFTDEQLQTLLEMGDITSAEADMYRQQRLAKELAKGVYRHKGRDVGSNLARAFSGIGAANYQRKAGNAQDEISGQYRQIMDKLYGPQEPTTPQMQGPTPNPAGDPQRQAMMAQQAANRPGPVPGQYDNMRGGPQRFPQQQQQGVGGPTPPMVRPDIREAQARALRQGQMQRLEEEEETIY
jgi:hypothetical protein